MRMVELVHKMVRVAFFIMGRDGKGAELAPTPWRSGSASLASPEACRDPRVSGQQVLPPILLQSPSGARLAYSNRSPSVHPRCSLRVPAVPAVARSIVVMEDVTPGRRRQ
ncbi:hypothetical protein O3P69_012380 [Scylla paramamosain]|uniref:Uncharacterized protein n=1 Tax=Scylla paramamosain TaxID=85552 RepID=A0AAW0SEI8_SCYPA